MTLRSTFTNHPMRLHIVEEVAVVVAVDEHEGVDCKWTIDWRGI